MSRSVFLASFAALVPFLITFELARNVSFAQIVGSDDKVQVVSEQAGDGYVLVVQGLDSLKDQASVKVWPWDANINTDPSMLGSVSRRGDELVFKPRFPISAGEIFNVEVETDEQLKPNNYRIEIAAVKVPLTKVRQIFPSADRIPENTLKFYVHFSAAMRKGDIYRYVSIREVDDGKKIELPFLEIEQEFWSRDSKRLTLLLDPGRIKRGLKPREEMGPIFVKGKSYELVVDGRWPDSNGKPLGEDFVKRFTVTGEDHTQPSPSRWKVTAPKTNSREMLTIKLKESLDHSMLESAIDVVDAQSQPVKGKITISKNETQWNFKPESDWQSGTYSIRIDSRLEDNAGNSIEKLFDVDQFHKTQPVQTAITELQFEIEKARK